MRLLFLLLAFATLDPVAIAQPKTPAAASTDDAWPFYRDASARIAEGDRLGKSSPAASTLEYDYPPFPPEWERMAKEAFEFNAPAFAKIRATHSMKSAKWPATGVGKGLELRYLNECRNIANEVGDAALYLHEHGDDAGAVEYVRDLLHMADLLDADPHEVVVQVLVATGIRAMATNRLGVITASVALTTNASERPKLQVTTAKAVIREVFTADDGTARLKDANAREGETEKMAAGSIDRTNLVVRRAQTDRNLAAMSLACHLFRLEKSRWPASAEEINAYLPAPPTDAWGPCGYVLIKGGLPDGLDRPLVYSRAGANGPLAYRVDWPQFGFYVDDGSGASPRRTPQGQFRDVVLWLPPAEKPNPTTRPLQ